MPNNLPILHGLLRKFGGGRFEGRGGLVAEGLAVRRFGGGGMRYGAVIRGGSAGEGSRAGGR